MIRQLWQSFLRTHYADKLAEVKDNRIYLISQTIATHRMLDEQEAYYSEKLLQTELEERKVSC